MLCRSGSADVDELGSSAIFRRRLLAFTPRVGRGGLPGQRAPTESQRVVRCERRVPKPVDDTGAEEVQRGQNPTSTQRSPFIHRCLGGRRQPRPAACGVHLPLLSRYVSIYLALDLQKVCLEASPLGHRLVKEDLERHVVLGNLAHRWQARLWCCGWWLFSSMDRNTTPILNRLVFQIIPNG